MLLDPHFVLLSSGSTEFGHQVAALVEQMSHFPVSLLDTLGVLYSAIRAFLDAVTINPTKIFQI